MNITIINKQGVFTATFIGEEAKSLFINLCFEVTARSGGFTGKRVIFKMTSDAEVCGTNAQLFLEKGETVLVDG